MKQTSRVATLFLACILILIIGLQAGASVETAPFQEGERLLSHYGIRDKTVETLNEHNEAAATPHVLGFLRAGRNVALISDAGTPVISDPGLILVQSAIGAAIPVVPVPGPSSIIPALTVSGFAIDRFVFCGFLSPKSGRRKTELHALRHEARTMILMDTPYRLLALLRDVGEALGGDRRVAIAFNLTQPGEMVLRGTASDLTARLEKKNLKGEFVLIVEGRRARNSRGD